MTTRILSSKPLRGLSKYRCVLGHTKPPQGRGPLIATYTYDVPVELVGKALQLGGWGVTGIVKHMAAIEQVAKAIAETMPEGSEFSVTFSYSPQREPTVEATLTRTGE